MGETAQLTERPQSGVRVGPGERTGIDGGRGGTAADPRVAGYVRVSQEKNVHKFGLDAQTKDIERYVEYRGWRPAKMYREEGVSGYRRDRPTLERMLADARAGKLDVVVFPSIDRAARSVADMIDIDAILRDANVGVIFVREGVDTSSPMGQFFRNVCASVAQFEGKLMYERLSKGKQRKAAQGGYIGGHLPFGYKSVDARAVVNEEAAEIVRLMFRLRIKENSFTKIVAELKRREVKTARGGRWSWGAVGSVLGNPYYTGWLRRGGELARGCHKPIISTRTFNKAQDVFRCAAGLEKARKETVALRARAKDIEAAAKQAYGKAVAPYREA
ncbi:MAG: recombinase family protein, partial [Planctomycetota bacterium]